MQTVERSDMLERSDSWTQSHNCNSNIDRIKKGPQNWRKIEGSGVMFRDRSFPADESMLSWKEYPRTVGGLAKYLSWFKDFKRPKELLSSMSTSRKHDQILTLFGAEYETTGKFLAHNLEQGSIGDNYFLTVAAALADRGNFITRLFSQKKYTEEGIFTVRGFVKGRPEDISIDDVLPAYSNRPAFAKPTQDGGWWLPLLEKAYAKAHNNYEMISSGTQAEAAQFLTGAPASEFQTSLYGADELWLSLVNAMRHKYLITSASFSDRNGLISGHGYIVKDFFFADDGQGRQVRLIKVKNPWKPIGDPSISGLSHGMWTGAYSNSDKESWTPQLKKKAKFDKLRVGEFYMTVEDFKDSFKYYTITYMRRGWRTSFVEKRASVNQRLYKFNFTVTPDDYNMVGKCQSGKKKAKNVKKKAAPAKAVNLQVGAKFEEDMEDVADVLLSDDGLVGTAAEVNAEAAAGDSETDAEIKDEEDLAREKRTRITQIEQAESAASNVEPGWAPDEEAASFIAEHEVQDGDELDSELLEDETDGDDADDAPEDGNSLVQKCTNGKNTGTMQVYVGAELYSKRMYPHGCPSYQKAFVKLFRVEKETGKLRLLDARFFDNREGFGYIMRNLTKGEYQVHFKKYSKGFDVFDFTVRLYGHRSLRLVDDDLSSLSQVKLSAAILDKLPTIKDHKQVQAVLQAESTAASVLPAPKQAPAAPVQAAVAQAAPAPVNQQANPVIMQAAAQPAPANQTMQLPVPAQTTPQPVAVPTTAVQASPAPTVVNVTPSLSQQTETADVQELSQQQVSREVLAQKLAKAASLVSQPGNDRLFEVRRRDYYYLKDALDKKHGYYFLRVGSDQDKSDLDLKVKLFLRGNQMETTETEEKLLIYKFPMAADQPYQNYRLTTDCKIRPAQGKKTCDFLVPTSYHEKTQVFVTNKTDAVAMPVVQPAVAQVAMQAPTVTAAAPAPAAAPAQEGMVMQDVATGQQPPADAPTVLSSQTYTVDPQSTGLAGFLTSVQAVVPSSSLMAPVPDSSVVTQTDATPVSEEGLKLMAQMQTVDANQQLLDAQEKLSHLQMADN